MDNALLNPAAVIGGNRPPPFDTDAVERRAAEAREWADAAGAWLDKGELETDADADAVKVLIEGARKLGRAVDEELAAARKPHDDAVKAVRGAYNPIVTTYDAMVKRLRPLVADFLTRKRVAAEAAAERARAEAAEAERLAAERLAAAQARHDVSGEVEAEAAAKDAAEAARAAAAPVKVSVGRDVGTGRAMALVKTKHVVIKHLRLAFTEVEADPGVIDAIQRALNARVRAKAWDGVIPAGCEIEEKESVR